MAAPAFRHVVIMWHDVFVMVDDGRAPAPEYAALGQFVMTEAAKHPAGIGALVIIPPEATPPSDDARLAMNATIQSLGSSLRGLCWLVEGGGFHGAMVRGVVTSIKMFGRLPYPSHVSTDITDALGWLLKRVDGNDGRLSSVPEGVRFIEAERRRS